MWTFIAISALNAKAFSAEMAMNVHMNVYFFPFFDNFSHLFDSAGSFSLCGVTNI